MPQKKEAAKLPTDRMIEKIRDVHATEGDQGVSSIYLRVFMDAADPIVIEDLSGVVIDLNVEAERSYGWSRAELIGQPIKRLVPTERHAQADELLRDCLDGGQVRNVEGVRVTRDGTELDVLLTLSLLRNESGEPVGIASIAKDITDLRMATAEYEGLVDAINRVQAMIEFNLDGTVINANENFLRIFGYRLDEIVGKHHRMFCEPGYAESPEYTELWRTLGRGEFKAGEFKRRSKDGTEVWLQASYNPIFDAEGKPLKVVKFASDITREVEARSIALLEMSTPVTAIWRDILMLPVVGIIDSGRAQNIMNAMLTAIAETQSRVIIMDISGVAVVDTAVANHLIKITKATKLMGCECTISGVSAAIAQTMVELGIEVGDVRTTATLKDALVEAFRSTGAEIRESR
jgi:methyl-accepting chemotaxis protein